jgi:hypothetical protein
MAEGNGNSDFVLGAAMGVGCGLLAGVVIVAALVYFAPTFLGITRPSDKSTEVIQKVSAPGDTAPASPFRR